MLGQGFTLPRASTKLWTPPFNLLDKPKHHLVFDTVLIANRGEIAVRIIRACREMGLRSVAIYSEADRLAPHVLAADEAYAVGPAPSAESYLRGDRIVEVGRRAGAGAIHPGYGFLAERASFAYQVEEAGLVFIGPRPETIAALGNKTDARRRMEAAGVPIVPGGIEPVSDAEEAARAATEVGFPLLLKAVAGGGGKGMRIVEAPQSVRGAFEAASREARAAFGDGSIYLEKYLASPRHIEIQILGDASGSVVHLGERECSIQRRHQKLIEEAPSALLTSEERASMGEAAVQAAEAVGYRGAGTVEFLYSEGQFFFLEMNTRLQVEHPVTEFVTGIDLVQWQIRIARGEALGFAQHEVPLAGHAIECRITSEDPRHGFLPCTGRVDRLDLPDGPGVRWDGGILEGFEVGLYYDPLLAKLIVHASTREEAIRRMGRALDELTIAGIETSASFHRAVMDEPDFRSGRLSTSYLEDHPDLLADPQEDLRVLALAAAVLEHRACPSRGLSRIDGDGAVGLSPWQASGWPWTS